MAETEDSENSQPPVLHVVVVGFHHKRGCQVDFSYPPLIPGESNTSSELPDEWRHLPFLALPDGAHNYKEDSIYFHLPGRGSSKDTVYGVSCYRQIDTKDLKSQQAEYTRGTVQKSVCVLSTLPLYGLIQAKLKLITHAYFGERDFSKTAILEDLYKSLNLSLHSKLLDDSQIFLGLDLRELVLRFKHKILVIFKLLMLEKRVLFFCSPAEELCASVLSFVSLFPGMLQNGLKEAACYRYYKPTTPSLVLEDFGIDTKEYMNIEMSHVPTYNHRRRRLQTRDKTRASQMSRGKVDICDTTDESSAGGTMSKSSQDNLSRDNLNTNFNRGNNTDTSSLDIDYIEEGNKESDLLTSAARASVYRRSLRRNGDLNGSPERQQIDRDDDLVSERTITNEKSNNNNIRNDTRVLKSVKQTGVPSQTGNEDKNSNRNSEFVKNNSNKNLRNVTSTTANQCNRLSRANLREMQKKSRPKSERPKSERPKSEQPRNDWDNISAYSSESMDVNARINAYFDTLAQKHEDSTSTCSISSYDTSSKDEASSSLLSDTATSSRLSEFSLISSDVSLSSRASLDITSDSYDMFPTVKVLEDELLNMIDQELYGPYFDEKRISCSTTNTGSCMSHTSTSNKLTTDTTQSLTDSGTEYESTPTGSVRNSRDLDRGRDSCRFSSADDFVVLPNTPAPTELDIDNFGFPLALFGKGALCHPYISLQQHDLLQDVNVRSFTIGASNMLFKHQRHLVDVLVEVGEGKVVAYDHELRRNLHLSTADLRFADFIVKHVAEQQEDVFLDQTGWEGGDEWIRAQFKVYLLSMLATEAHGNSEQEADFNDNFIRAWKTTHNYRIWKSKEFENMDYIHPGHPFTGGIGVSDMKIKLQSAMQTTDRGKKLNSTISKTSDAILHTGKAVGGVLHNAKSAVSSWFSSFAGGEWKIDEEEAQKEAEKEAQKKETERKKKEAEQKKKEEKAKKDSQKKNNKKDEGKKLEEPKKEEEEDKMKEIIDINEDEIKIDGVKRLYLIEEERKREEERRVEEIKRREEETKQREDEEIKSMLVEVDKAVELQMEKEREESDGERKEEEEEEEEEMSNEEDILSTIRDSSLIETDVDTGEEIVDDKKGSQSSLEGMAGQIMNEIGMEGQTTLDEMGMEGQIKLDEIEGMKIEGQEKLGEMLGMEGQTKLGEGIRESEEIDEDEFEDALEENENKRNEIRLEETKVAIGDDDYL